MLWLLVGRGLALELRHQIDNPLWRARVRRRVLRSRPPALALVFGVALGNVVRGVPLGADGYFSLPLFNILNWYALLIGVFGLVVLAAHGARFLACRGHRRAGRARAALGARAAGSARSLLFLALIGPTYAVRDEMLTNLADHPWRLVFPLLARRRRWPAMLIYQRRGEWAARVRRLVPVHRRPAHDDGRRPLPERAAGARGQPATA